jgi:AcrR family transcriptional regulator
MNGKIGKLILKGHDRAEPRNATAAAGRKRNRAGKQEALIRAATKLFASQGYEATTTRQIADFAGCAEGLIHRYFTGKSGLLFAIMNFHASREVHELNESLPLAANLKQEIQQLIDWEVDRMWKDRELLRVSLPQALLDRRVGKFVSRVGPQRHAQAMMGRLRRHRGAARLKPNEIEALSHAIGALGFFFGFMRPAVLGYERRQARKFATNVARIFAAGGTQLS